MRRRRMRKKGFTLMEVLISIAVVGLLFAPMLTFFSHSAKLNVNAKNMQRANTVAQSVMEEVRSYDSIASMATVYQDINNGNLKRTDDKFSNLCNDPIVSSGGAFNNTEYYFVRDNIVSDGKTYTAKITIKPSDYPNLNNEGMPVISSLGSGSTVMALEKDETMNALYEYQSRHHVASGGSVELDNLAKKLKKTLKIRISDVDDVGNPVSEGMLRVTIYNEYKIDDTSIAGCDQPITSAYLYNEEVVYEKLKGIYMFYNYDVFNTTVDIFQGIEVDVDYQRHPTWTCDYKLYAICQQVFSVNNSQVFKDEGTDKKMTDYITHQNSDVKTKITKNIRIAGNYHSTNENYITIFSNFPYALRAQTDTGVVMVEPDGAKENMETIVSEEKIQRLASVKVEIYQGTEKCTELVSTRGE